VHRRGCSSDRLVGNRWWGADGDGDGPRAGRLANENPRERRCAAVAVAHGVLFFFGFDTAHLARRRTTSRIIAGTSISALGSRNVCGRGFGWTCTARDLTVIDKKNLTVRVFMCLTVLRGARISKTDMGWAVKILGWKAWKHFKPEHRLTYVG
jgi:hypothetical protein